MTSFLHPLCPVCNSTFVYVIPRPYLKLADITTTKLQALSAQARHILATPDLVWDVEMVGDTQCDPLYSIKAALRARQCDIADHVLEYGQIVFLQKWELESSDYGFLLPHVDSKDCTCPGKRCECMRKVQSTAHQIHVLRYADYYSLGSRRRCVE
jgi:hypothetical protein